MRILIADDHDVTIRGLRALLESSGHHIVVGEVRDGLTAVREIETLRPGAVILDLSLPGLHGLEVLRQGRRMSPDTKFVVLSMHGEDAIVARAFNYGANAYVLKGASADALLEALAEVEAGRRYVSDGLDSSLLDTSEEHTIEDRYDSLTPREREVLQLSAEGCTSHAIAERLFISPRTAEKHRANLMAKLGLRNQSEVVKFAIERGIIHL